MNVVDWRNADRTAVHALYEAGQARWLHTLGWDMSDTWRALEHARTTWGLPGLLARDDDGVVQGWTFFLQDRGVLQVGGLSAENVAATAALLDNVVQQRRTRAADSVSCFLFEEAPGLSAELAKRGFGVTPFAYLTRDVSTLVDVRANVTARDWHAGDVAAAADLLRATYTPAAGRHFAPGHSQGAWCRYVHNLVTHTGCGTLLPDLTRVVDGDAGMLALVVVTALSHATIHLAQVAVHPGMQGHGLARALIADACVRAAACGYRMVTLLVDTANAPANALYRRMGFRESARFVAAALQR